tara:strand:+ start:50 stop:766 length:717 start_codon:yes stop_codon:yes gene_type:complete
LLPADADTEKQVRTKVEKMQSVLENMLVPPAEAGGAVVALGTLPLALGDEGGGVASLSEGGQEGSEEDGEEGSEAGPCPLLLLTYAAVEREVAVLNTVRSGGADEEPAVTSEGSQAPLVPQGVSDLLSSVGARGSTLFVADAAGDDWGLYCAGRHRHGFRIVIDEEEEEAQVEHVPQELSFCVDGLFLDTFGGMDLWIVLLQHVLDHGAEADTTSVDERSVVKSKLVYLRNVQLVCRV